MHLIEGAGRSGVLHGVDDLPPHQVLDRLASARDALPERLRGGGDARRRRTDTELELHLDVRPQAVSGQQGVRAVAGNAKRHRPHRDFLDLMEDRQRGTAAVHDHPLSAEPGPHQGGLAVGLDVEAVQKPDRERRDERQDHDREEPDHDALPRRCDGVQLAGPSDQVRRILFSFSSIFSRISP